MRSIRLHTALLAGAQLGCMAAFFYAVHRADSAMDKTGLGDHAAFARWSGAASVWFWSSLILWIAAIGSFAWPAPPRARAALVYGVLVLAGSSATYLLFFLV